MGVVAVVAGVVAPLAVVAILACRAIPDHVLGLELFAETVAMREWDGFGGAASLGIIIVVLWHGMPPYVAFVCVGNSCGQGNAPSPYGFGSVMVGDEGSVVEVGMDA